MQGAAAHDIDQIIISELEHASIDALAQIQLPVPVRYCQTNTQGSPDLQHLETLLKAGRSLVAMMHVNNETGCIFPIKEIGRLVKLQCGTLHVDIAQSLEKIAIQEVIDTADSLSFSFHKINGPTGVGCLAIKKAQRKLSPIYAGGGQEAALRSGTICLPLIAGAAASLTGQIPRDPAHSQTLETFFEKTVEHYQIISSDAPKSPFIQMVCFPGVINDDLIAALSQKNIWVGKGSACNAWKGNLSRVLSKMKVDDFLNESCIRLSFSKTTQHHEVTHFMTHFPDCYEKALAQSPYHAHRA